MPRATADSSVERLSPPADNLRGAVELLQSSHNF